MHIAQWNICNSSLSKKERNCDICDNVDRPRGYYIKRSKSVKEKLPDVQAGFRKGR